MEAPKPAIFKLERFTITKFSFEEPEAKFSIVDVNFNPTGIYNPKEGEFKLTIGFSATASTEGEQKEYRDIIKGVLESYFQFEKNTSFKDIPDFFNANSIAIVYPFIRAFVSTITLQAGLRLLVLPILNLNSLSATLKEQTTVLN
ncbi:MAG: hypothetical protein WBB20_14850 [Chitinophagaceae bacterium]